MKNGMKNENLNMTMSLRVKKTGAFEKPLGQLSRLASLALSTPIDRDVISMRLTRENQSLNMFLQFKARLIQFHIEPRCCDGCISVFADSRILISFFQEL